MSRSCTSSRKCLPVEALSRFPIHASTRVDIPCVPCGSRSSKPQGPQRNTGYFIMNPVNRFAVVTVWVLLTLLSPGASKGASSSIAAPDTAYVRSFEKWKAEQISDLKQNWLPLAGLFWLKPGRNSFGASPDSALIFASGPVHAGEVDLDDNGTAKTSKVTLKLLPGIQASIAGKPVRDDTILAPDTSGHPSVVEMGTLQFHV